MPGLPNQGAVSSCHECPAHNAQEMRLQGGDDNPADGLALGEGFWLWCQSCWSLQWRVHADPDRHAARKGNGQEGRSLKGQEGASHG